MDLILWSRDNIGYIFLGVVILFFVFRGVVVWFKNRNAKAAAPQQQPYNQNQFFLPPQGNIQPFGAYDINTNLLQQKAYIEEQLKDIERESKIVADELNLLDGNYQNQKITLQNKKQACMLKYNMWRKHLDEVNMQVGPQVCKQADGNRFRKLGEL